MQECIIRVQNYFLEHGEKRRCVQGIGVGLGNGVSWYFLHVVLDFRGRSAVKTYTVFPSAMTHQSVKEVGQKQELESLLTSIIPNDAI